MKIVVIGFSGSGKSTLAMKLGEFYNHYVLHMDKIAFNKNWVKLSRLEINKRLLNILDNYDSWIIDGNYLNIEFERRCLEADVIYFLNFNRFYCFFSAFKRFLQNRNKVRTSAPEGCVEKFDFDFMKWLLIDGRRKKRKRKLKDAVLNNKDKSIEFKNRRQLNKYLFNLFSHSL